MRWLLLENKPRLFERHQERLERSPDPDEAKRMFGRRLQTMKQVQGAKIACFVGVYFFILASIVGFILTRIPALEDTRRVVEFFAGVASSLTLAFLAGVLVANRYLGLLEVELFFYSQESNLQRPPSPQ